VFTECGLSDTRAAQFRPGDGKAACFG